MWPRDPLPVNEPCYLSHLTAMQDIEAAEGPKTLLVTRLSASSVQVPRPARRIAGAIRILAQHAAQRLDLGRRPSRKIGQRPLLADSAEKV
jgi:hypothetical protein